MADRSFSDYICTTFGHKWTLWATISLKVMNAPSCSLFEKNERLEQLLYKVAITSALCTMASQGDTTALCKGFPGDINRSSNASLRVFSHQIWKRLQEILVLYTSTPLGYITQNTMTPSRDHSIICADSLQCRYRTCEDFVEFSTHKNE